MISISNSNKIEQKTMNKAEVIKKKKKRVVVPEFFLFFFLSTFEQVKTFFFFFWNQKKKKKYLIAYAVWQIWGGGLSECSPRWVWFVLLLGAFFYHTFDGLDGKQARRTGNSSPLGQLFDHGCDAFIYTPILMTQLSQTQYGVGWTLHGAMICAYIVFYMLNWRCRHQGQFFFGFYSVSEANVTGWISLLISSIAGCEIYQTKISIVNFQLNTGDLLLFVLIFACIWTTISEFLAVSCSQNRNFSFLITKKKLLREYYAKCMKEGKEDPGSYIELVQVSVFLITFVFWALTGAFEKHPYLFLWTEGLIFSGLVHRLIVADVCKLKTRKFYNLLALLPIISIFSVLDVFFNVNVLACLPTTRVLTMSSGEVLLFIFVWELVCWLLYVVRVINEIAAILKIHVFFITDKHNKGH
ncbi:CDP-alcohol phosphatidyltransferase [Reticulomyxa filosa]|uniref:CDP-alcohol phosphatidyltransferase n=1 Tax=Reticulomyxa filosa TaxID=46433 RepID=X6PFR5_RETFI|nr:CDP-alcohol phosphatidyltransferase [Reticulomyxa filosa]|eukprot:ETO36527.1 CDP-alcohol phosphatidyltransferase [Reticulomyxa filosa]